MIPFSHKVEGGLDMSLFFEEEIRKVKKIAGSSEIGEMTSQDPRVNGQMPSGTTRSSFRSINTDQEARRKRQW